MTEVAAPIGRVRPDARPPITPAQAAAHQEACAAAAAIHSALELGVVARVTEAPADPAAVAADCGLTRQGAEALLSALAGLDLLELGADGRFQPASSGLAELAELLRPWVSLQPALPGERRPARCDRAARSRPSTSSQPSAATDRGRLSCTPSGSCCAQAAVGSTPTRPFDAGSAKEASRTSAVATSPARFRSRS